MRYFLDTEFDERGPAGRKDIQLISLALVADDGRELYLENHDYAWGQEGIDPWLAEHVRPHLRGGDCAVPAAAMADRLVEFFAGDEHVEVWAYFADYDWVVLCSVFGRMIDLPANLPRYCLDIKQAMVAAGYDKGRLPAQAAGEHDALADARHNRVVFDHLVAAGVIAA